MALGYNTWAKTQVLACEYTVTLGVLQQSQSAISNSTTYGWTLTIEATGTNLGNNIFLAGSSPYTVTIDGQEFSGTTNANINVNAGPKTLVEGTVVVPHKSDGTKTVSISFTLKTGVMSLGTFSSSASFEAEDILRKAELMAAPNFTDEDSPTITYINAVDEKMPILQACIANSTGNIIYVPYRDIPKAIGEGGITQYTFELTDAELETLYGAVGSSNTSLPVRFYVKSGEDGELHYSFLSRTLTIKPVKPTVELQLNDVSTITTALTGDNQIIIAGYSDIHYEVLAAPQKGATITKYSVFNGNSTRKVDEGYFNNTKNGAFTATVEDSRGYTTTVSRELSVVNYFRVTCNQEIVLNMDGTIEATVTGNYFNGSFGANANTLTVQIRHRQDGGSWGSWVDLTPLISEISGGTYKMNTTMSGFDPNGTYEFQSRAIDKLVTATSGTNSVVLLPIFDWGRNDFNFNVPVTIEGAPLDDYVIAHGTETMGTNGTWYWRKWKNGKAEAWGCQNYGKMAITTAWGGLYRSAVFEQLIPGVFLHTPDVIDISLRDSDFGGWVCKHESIAPTSQSVGFMVVRPASATTSYTNISFHLIGRWK